MQLIPATSPPPLQDGVTPLHAAAINGRAQVVALLLATPGVDPTLKDKVRDSQRRLCGPPAYLPAPRPSPLVQRGLTPLVMARGQGRDAAVALLEADPRVAAALAAQA